MATESIELQLTDTNGVSKHLVPDKSTQEDEEEIKWTTNSDPSDIKCCCCCSLSGFGIICWNLVIFTFNIITSFIFIFGLILIYSPDQALMAYAIIVFIIRTITDCIGFRVVYVLKKKQWDNDERSFDNFLFFYGVSILWLTIIIDIVFLVFFNYFLTFFNTHPEVNGALSIVYALNILWIIDIIAMMYTTFKYFKYTHINPKSQYQEKYKRNPYFWILIIFGLILFIWGICQIVTAFQGTTTIKVHEPGYSIEYYVSYNKLPTAKQMQGVLINDTLTDSTPYIVYVCSDEGVYALIDRENDQKNDDIYFILPSIERKCSSVAIDRINNIVYITEYDKTYKCDTSDKLDEYSNIHQQVLAGNNIRSSCNIWFEQEYYSHHGWHITNFNPINNHLCMSMGVHCNTCLLTNNQGNIWCFNDMNNPSFSNATMMVTGTRDVVGFVFDEYDGENTLWFTDHNADALGEDLPDCELNKMSYVGENFGFPRCHSVGEGDVYQRDAGKTKNYVDPIYGPDINNNCSTSKYTPAIQPLGPHVAPDGLIITRDLYNNDGYKVILVAEHGSWNRATYIGYRVVKVVLDGNDNVIEHSIFVDGWINEKKQLYSGRPVHLLGLDDGSILISDNVANTIYRVYYDDKGGNSIEQSCIGGHIDKAANWFAEYRRGETLIADDASESNNEGGD